MPTSSNIRKGKVRKTITCPKHKYTYLITKTCPGCAWKDRKVSPTYVAPALNFTLE